MINAKKQEYDVAQKLGEQIENLESQPGWKLFIKLIEDERDHSQEQVNDPECEMNNTQFHRGCIKMCDIVLNYVERKKKIAMKVMRDTTTAKIEN